MAAALAGAAPLKPATPASSNLPASGIASVSVPFVANEGQLDSEVAFYARTFAGTVFVTTAGRLVYSLAAGRQPAPAASPEDQKTLTGWTLSESFAAALPKPVGLRPAVGRISNFKGRIATPYSDLQTYQEIGLGDVAPGISLALRASGSNIEKVFNAAPGADVTGIRVQLDGAERLTIAEDGGLIVGTGLGNIQFTAPIAYQERGGKRFAVKAQYALADNGGYGFTVGDYDRSLPLAIDPLIRSTYSGGSQVDVIRAMLVHPGSGDIYVAGSTASTNFPGTATGGQTTNHGNTDAFVAHYDATLTNLLRASYYGGTTGSEVANAIAILPSTGDIYIAGSTSSSDLPNITGGTFNNGAPANTNLDAFVARFDGALSTVLGARYYGGTGSDNASGLAIDTIAGGVTIVGDTNSTDLPLGAGPAQGTSGGGQDAFLARFSPDLATLFRGTYFGGNAADRALAAAFDPLTGDIVVAGVTGSTNLPGATNGALSTSGGLNDGFVARFDGSLGILRQSTYFGGSGADQINAVAIHPLTGQVYVAGDTLSLDLRGKPAGQFSPGGGNDAFVARFHQDLTGLLGVTYFGGTGNDFGNALAISKYTGEIYLAGYSTAGLLPGRVGGIQEINAGSNDAYVARFDAGLSGVKQATLVGGAGSDIAYAVAVTDSVAYIAGETSSSTFPGAVTGTPGSAQPASGGSTDGFISALGSDLRLGNSNPAAFAFAAVGNALPSSVQISAPAQVMPTGSASAYVDGQPGSLWCASSAANCGCDLTGNVFIAGSTTLATTAPNPYYVCVRNTASAAPNAIVESTLHIGAVAATFRVGTGAIAGFGCTLDVDGNGTQDALTDGLLILRALFGLTGTAVTDGATGVGATRSTWSDIGAYLNTNCGGSFSP